LQRLAPVTQVAVYAVPDERVGDQIMAAFVLGDGLALTPTELAEFLAAQPDLSPKAWPRFVRVNRTLPQTATNKILKRELIKEGVTAGDGVLWERPDRTSSYVPTVPAASQTR
jgi:fatty-acyl-CoA synthase